MDRAEISGAAAGVDARIPRVSQRGVKWYAESPDLHILFNTRRMERNNPLLALGAYGSLCWRGVLAGWTVGKIRREAQRAFGQDEVIAFLKHLMATGMIENDVEIAATSCPPERLVKEYPAPEVQFRLAHAAIPWYCLWEVNTRCNLRCRVCYLPHFNGAGPDLERALELAQQIVDAGIFYVCLLGGEPLLRDDLEAIIERLRSAGVFAKVITNGLLLSPARAESLNAAGLNQIEISFDGLTAAGHEASRGVGTFAQARRAVREARTAGIPRVAAVWTLHSGNVDELDLLPSFLTDLGLRECYVSPFKKTGRNGSRAPFEPPSGGQLSAMRQRLGEWRQAFPELEITLLPGCSCGRTSIVVGDDGDLRLCSFSHASVGNVFRMPLMQIWRSLVAQLPPAGPAGYCTRAVKRPQAR